jgi:hypothetical protein
VSIYSCLTIAIVSFFARDAADAAFRIFSHCLSFNFEITAIKFDVVRITPEYGWLIDKPSTVVVSALSIIDDNCRGIYFIDRSRTADLGPPFAYL